MPESWMSPVDQMVLKRKAEMSTFVVEYYNHVSSFQLSIIIILLYPIIKGSLDAKLPSYELLKMLKVIDS